MGFKNLIPPFANISNSDILQGVNYASGAAGIRIETGTHLGVDISLGLQLNHHRVIVSQIAAKYGSFEKAQTQLNKCLYYLNIGSNDYINNYFMPNHYLTSRFFTLEDYTLDLITKYSLTLRLSFLKKLKSLVDEFNNQLSTTNAKFIFINSTAVNLDPPLGFKVLDAGCCKVGEIGQCVANEKPCENRNEYVFYDGFHPTEALNVLTAIASYNASNPAFTYPMDISHLILS
ncbi:GDSL esterase/lipase [Senna tora]|uniref:GDSL esterase/lipase n=1 Tax=Senna tora TaxID=362788 RepID=A0A834X7P6_9FABA|nr:GDSL esterase/lipase [Senna tora]